MIHRFSTMIGLILFIFLSAKSQNTLGGVNANAIEMNTSIGGMIMEMNLEDYSPIGNVYLYEDWKNSGILQKDII